jgi:hypothetical protein
VSGQISGLRGQRTYGQHGNRHAPRGSDPSPTDVWIYVGVDPRCPFVNGSNAPPSIDIPNPVPMRFRISVGPPNECEYAGWEGTDPSTGDRPVASSINYYTDHQIEIQGDVTGLSPGDIVFVLPLEYTHDYDVPYHTHDDSGVYVPCRLLSTGEFIYDVP